jgi:multimeric flavodoxin WrbA
MKKVIAFVGSARKKATYQAVQRFLAQLQSLGEIEGEIVFLSDYDLDPCRGCKQCFDRGEEFCPLKDDRDALVDKMIHADGVVFASPNYAFQVSGYIKTFLDRIAYILHRPRFFGQAFTSIVVQGIYGGQDIVKYLDLVGNGLGFATVKGCCLTALEPMSTSEQVKMDQALARQSRRFYARLMGSPYPAPRLFNLMAFRMSRTSMKRMLDDSNRDFSYYAERGWFESDYYYPTRLGVFRRLMGGLFDAVAARMAGDRDRQGSSGEP